MTDFNTYTMRHGEASAQSLIELMERNEGLRHKIDATLEDRWNAVMMDTPLKKAA